MPGGQVDYEKIQDTPRNLRDVSNHVFAHHRPAQDIGVSGRGDECRGHDFYAEFFDGQYLRALINFGDADHFADGGAENVSIDQANLKAFFLQGDGEIDGDGGFAHAAFAAGDGDGVFDLIFYLGSWRGTHEVPFSGRVGELVCRHREYNISNGKMPVSCPSFQVM